jgi:hypothetical protein
MWRQRRERQIERDRENRKGDIKEGRKNGR